MGSFTKDTAGTLTNGLIGAFKFQGDATNAIGTNHGTLNGGATYSTSYGKSDQGIAFNGITGYISVPSLFSAGSTITISAWVYCTAATNNTLARIYRWGVRSGCNPSSSNFGMGYSTTNGFFMYSSAGCENQPLSTNLTYTVGTWAHILITINGTGTNVMARYFNGASLGTRNYGNLQSLGNGDHEIGADWDGGTHVFNSANWYMDEIYVWNRVLNSTEIADLYNTGTGSFYVATTTYTRTIADSMMNSVSRAGTLTRTLSSRRSMTDTIMNAASRFASPSAFRSVLLTISDSMMNAVGRLATIAHGLAHVRAMSDTLMNAAGRADSLSRIVSFVRTATDSLMNAAARLATLSRSAVSIMRTMSDSMMNSAGRFSFLKTFLNGLNSRYSAKDPRTGTTSYSETHPRRGTSYDKTYPDA